MDTLRKKIKKASNSRFRRCRISRPRKIPNSSFSDLKIEAGALVKMITRIFFQPIVNMKKDVDV